MLFALSVLVGCLKHLKPGIYVFESWEISDWLINFEGGFVRRGITGQLLLELERLHLYDVRVAILLLCAVFSLAILFILLRIFKKEGWSLLIIPTGLCLGFTFMNVWGRRDMLSLTLTFLIFINYRKALSQPQAKWPWASFHLLSVLQILIHEASFFYTFPILMLHSFHQLRRQGLGWVQSAAHTLLRFLPMLVTMCLVCLFKGNPQIAETVWASWGPVFSAYQPSATSEVGLSVSALGWDAMETFGNHIYTAFIGCRAPAVWRIPLSLFNLVVTYFLLTRLGGVKPGIYAPKVMDNVTMSDIALVQFAALLPMYTVLSCDWGRTLPYLVISSVFFYHLFKQDGQLFSQRLTAVSERMQGAIASNKVLSLPVLYILLVLLTPIPRYHAPFDSLNTFQQKFITEMLHIIKP